MEPGNQHCQRGRFRICCHQLLLGRDEVLPIEKAVESGQPKLPLSRVGPESISSIGTGRLRNGCASSLFSAAISRASTAPVWQHLRLHIKQSVIVRCATWGHLASNLKAEMGWSALRAGARWSNH